MNYLIWLFIFIWIPTLILWYFNYSLLRRYKKTLAYAMFFALVFSVPWDIFAIANKLWIFPKEGNIGFFLLGLPIEEYLFMMTVTLLIGSVTIIVKYRQKYG